MFRWIQDDRAPGPTSLASKPLTGSLLRTTDPRPLAPYQPGGIRIPPGRYDVKTELCSSTSERGMDLPSWVRAEEQLSRMVDERWWSGCDDLLDVAGAEPVNRYEPDPCFRSPDMRGFCYG